MPFSNYTELKAAVKGWLHRSDLVAQIPDFIALAETGINRIAQVRAMENEVPLALAVSARTIPLPAGFTSPLAVWLGATHRHELAPATPEELPVTSAPGRPTYWAIDGTSLAFDCPSDAARTVTLRYRGGFRLTDAAPTNALLTKYPDLYLYGTLLQAAPFIRDNDSIPLWQAMYGQAVKEINATESRARAVAPLRTEIAQVLGCDGSDFYRGY
jgi:hypothetical protein